MALTDTSYGGYLAKVRGSESGGNPNAKNPRSSASGLYQFTKGTWEGLGYDWKDRFNTNLQNQAMSKLTSSNANYLKSKLGINPSDADLYGAHFLGPAGYSSIYRASSNTPLSNILSAGEISANPFLKGKTAGYLKNWLTNKMGQEVSQGAYNEYGVDTSLNLPMNTGDYQTAPDIASKEDLEAEQAKAELLEKQKEKDFISEVQARQDQDSERRYQQEQQIQQGQEGDLDPSYYQVPQVELPNYQAIKYEQAQLQTPQEQPQYKDGGEIEGRVKCSSCGWEWDKSDSSEEDMYNCHKCGGQNTGKDVMKNGGQMITKYEDGGESSEFDNASARDWWVKKTGKTWAEAKKLGYSDGTASSNIELLNRLKDKNFKIANNNKTSQRSDMKQFNGFSQEEQNSMQNIQPPVTRKTVKAPIAKAKKEIKEVDQMSLFEKVMRGDFSPQGSERKLQNGVITDKRTNTSYIIENGDVKKAFPVLTGANPDMNINDKGVAYLETHPESKATPRGTYIMNPKDDIYGQPGFRLNPVAAFGEPAARAKDIAQHVTYDFEKRNPLYAQGSNKRYASYGCINCRKPDINYMTDRFKKGDTTMVIDSKIKRDADFLSKKLFTRK